MRSGCNYFKNVIVTIERIAKSLFVCIVTTRNTQKRGSMSTKRRGCKKPVDAEGNPLTFKLYLPLRNVVDSVHLAKGENILEYQVKANALWKPKHNCLSFTLVLQGV